MDAGASIFLSRLPSAAPAILPGRHAVSGFELAVEIREIFKSHLSCNEQNGVGCLTQTLRRNRQTTFIQIGYEAAAGHLLEPAHKMTGTASASLCHLFYRQRLRAWLAQPEEMLRAKGRMRLFGGRK